MNKLMKLTIIFLWAFSIVPSIGQSLCDTSSKDVFVWSEYPPEMNIGIHDLENIINQDIKLADYHINQDKIIYLSLIINCKGEQFNYKVSNSDNQVFNKALTDCVNKTIFWIPGKHNGKTVDFSYTFTIKLQSNIITILDSKEKKKLEKKRLRNDKNNATKT
jgi:hypothetical protein